MSPMDTGAPIPECVDVVEAQRRGAAGWVLLDVREDHEWATGHAPGAHHLPLGLVDADTVPAQGPLVLVCRSGNRSGQACERLIAAGRTDVVNMSGGMLAWAEAGLPIVHPEAPSTGGPAS
ncbi:rhodanese-like domain-containing protein [Nocardioides sp.]|uniref:rhodanese-like domain-containing protein n=1 Tax=Nocardioides sp. TaxID=35761 RepID=UPI0035155ECD